MNSKNTAEIQRLEKLILHHKNCYYRGSAEISDEDFDQLEEKLKRLDSENPVLKMVGSEASSQQKVPHQSKMLSLEKTYELEKMKEWVGGETVLTTLKYDGSACSLIYKNGKLILAKTRGDGEFGENVTNKIFYIANIPKHISDLREIEIRGEVYCSETDFLHLAQEMGEKKLEKPSSQRNIVAGLLGRKDHLGLCYHLRFSAFDIKIKQHSFASEREKLELLKKINFEVPRYRKCTAWSEVEEEIKFALEFMNSGEFLVDGIVITYDECKKHNELGETSHHPRYKLAFKFIGESKNTKVKAIEWGMSRNGIYTPVAIVDPVELSGALVSRVTLHNFGMVQTFNLKKNDTIEVIRSGEVIPKFIKVVSSSTGKLEFPSKCFSCSTKLEIDDLWLFCPNKQCPAKIEQEILHYMKTIGIEDISDKRLREMIVKGLVSGIQDIYKIRQEDFLQLDKVKEILANKFYHQIQKSKNVSLVKFISALGIEGLGETKVQKIIDDGFNSWDKISAMKIDELMNINGFAEKSSKVIIGSLKQKSKLVQDLFKAGLKIRESVAKENLSNKLAGFKLCITGTMSIPRQELAEIIKSHGGVMQDSVNKETKYLVANAEESNSSKYIKAKKLGTSIISEEDLYQILEEKHGKR